MPFKQAKNEKKIRVLRIINRFNIGGPTYNATFLTRFMSDEFETILVGGLPEDGEADSLHVLKEYGIEPLLITEMKRKPSLWSDWRAYVQIKKIIREFQPDIVHTHASKAGAIGRRAAKKLGVPVIIHTFHGHVFHSYFGKVKTFIYQTIERRLANASSGIVAISEIQKKELAHDYRICDENKIKVIPLGFDLLKFHEKREENRSRTRAEFHIDDNEIAIAIVGRLVPVKNHLFFLDAIEKLVSKTERSVVIFIVGDGTEKDNIEQRIKRMTIPNNFRLILTSWVKEIDRFNAGMDIICLSSNNEGTPVSLIEAQAANIPVITTDVGGVRDIIRDGETGYIVPKGDVFAYTEKLLELIEDEKKRKKMSQNGWSFVEDKFHYQTLVKNMEKYYKELLHHEY